ncbi:MAG: Methyltransferase type 11 [Bacteroidetes bacterium]|nr:Methyltransferase type 11 [Bacteroidota bacterium]
MSNGSFAFKQFTIKQDKCAMKVGTDAVLLGAWIYPNGSKKILDIGTGTGIIALMLAQKSKAEIIAIDIDKSSTEQAKTNVLESSFKNIQVLHVSLQDLANTSEERFNLIVTNPPYFIDSLKSSNGNRTIARHADLLPFEDLIAGVKKLLDEKGKFCLILPKNEAAIFREMAKQKGLYLSKLLRIRTRSDKDTEKRHIMQFEFKETEFSESTLVIESDRNMKYSDEYRELTKDYYLNF